MQFATDIDKKYAVTSWQQTLDTNLFYTGIKALVTICAECINIIATT
jgi:hypothetical protein